MARSVDDCDLVLKAISGHDAQDAGSLPGASAKYTGAEESRRPLRVGWIANQWKEIAPDVNKAMSAAHDVLKASHALKMSTVSLPEGPWEAAAGTIVSVEGASAFKDLIESGRVSQLNDPLGKIGGYMNEAISASDFMLAERIRRILQKKMAEVFTKVDVLATASLPVTAPRLEANLDDALTFADPIGGIGNICGLPAISVPCGFGHDQLPVGVQFIGRPLDDAAVVQAARVFQSQTEWHKRHPQFA